MNPIYSRSSRLVKSRRGLVTQRGKGLTNNLLLATLTKTLKRRKKVQKGGWIGPEVSRPPGYDIVRTLQKGSKRRRKRQNRSKR